MAHLIDPETSRYMSLAAAAPKLGATEELQLAANAQRGDAEAANRLITANLRNVVPMALKYRSYGVPVADLIAEGNLALMKALERFEPERGLRFVTYAKFWVRADMLALAMRSRSMVGGGRGQLQPKFFFRLRREYGRLKGLIGDEARVRCLLAEEFNTTPTEVQSILARIGGHDSSLDAQVGESGGSLIDLLGSGAPTQEEDLAARQLGDKVRRALPNATRDFSDRERFIVERRMMADREDELTLVDVGRKLGVSRERARQIESGIKHKLRKRLRSLAPLAA